ncbi:MAG TPA: hypothetical protein VMJ10_28055 [Kofleriaceae bacterium]|nr:hypothetical protein [Kofleriaceae bacterium]
MASGDSPRAAIAKHQPSSNGESRGYLQARIAVFLTLVFWCYLALLGRCSSFAIARSELAADALTSRDASVVDVVASDDAPPPVTDAMSPASADAAVSEPTVPPIERESAVGWRGYIELYPSLAIPFGSAPPSESSNDSTEFVRLSLGVLISRYAPGGSLTFRVRMGASGYASNYHLYSGYESGIGGEIASDFYLSRLWRLGLRVGCQTPSRTDPETPLNLIPPMRSVVGLRRAEKPGPFLLS